MSSSTRRELPPWSLPTHPKSSSSTLPPLRIYNSLTRKKEPFVPLDPRGRKVTWYCCGPTVYDAAHLGHARNYVTTDVLRRIMRDYFGFDIVFVQNVTDVDDKIILRARQKHLFDEFVAANPSFTPELAATCSEAWQAYLTTNLSTAVPSVDPKGFETWSRSVHPELMDMVIRETLPKNGPSAESSEEVTLDEKTTKFKMHLTTLWTASRAILTAERTSLVEFYAATASVLLPYLDSLHKDRDFAPEVFSKLSSYWERHFNHDMATLNVLPPTSTTRVSEFIPENVAFVDKLVQRGFAYPTVDGSVYFDIAAYEAAGHHYAKLQPWNRGDESLMADGEGALTAEKSTTVEFKGDRKSSLPEKKKNAQDFALWKASKAREPSWESPWGKGRPGWHIECSVMCSEVLGGQVDIHSGGIDLAFPHHDNEIAQSEAYWDGCNKSFPTTDGKHQWINYFLHMGHLQIHGSKMSKSLKNFVSVRDALQRGGWTARGLRIVFLMGGWKDGIEVREGVLAEARNWEAIVGKFFSNVKALVAEESERESSGSKIAQPWGDLERVLAKEFDNARANLDTALCDSFNTLAAMKTILDIIGETNKYMAATSSLALVKDVGRWVTKIISIFGLDPYTTPNGADRIGWSETSSGSSTNVEDVVLPYIRVLSTFRDAIRQTAISSPNNDLSKEFLALCDRLRDYDLAELGVSLDDRDSADGKPALIKFVPAEELRTAREEKEQRAKEKAAKKEEARLKREEEERNKAEQGRLDPTEMYKVGEEATKWSAWDEQGIPVQDKDGAEVTKNKKKTLLKGWERQKKAHDAWRNNRRGSNHNSAS